MLLFVVMLVEVGLLLLVLEVYVSGCIVEVVSIYGDLVVVGDKYVQFNFVFMFFVGEGVL